jgi:hypothetical protein
MLQVNSILPPFITFYFNSILPSILKSSSGYLPSKFCNHIYCAILIHIMPATDPNHLNPLILSDDKKF